MKKNTTFGINEAYRLASNRHIKSYKDIYTFCRNQRINKGWMDYTYSLWLEFNKK